MTIISIILILFFMSSFIFVFGQDGTPSKNELIVTDEQRIILFTTAIFIVIGIFLYMARNIILRKKTSYDEADVTSKKDRDYEKYHSDWTDDYEEPSSRTDVDDEEFRKAVYKSTLPNYYEILGITKDATQGEIKKRYRQLVKQLHPDRRKEPDSKEKMAEINKAYEILSDNERRERYDKYLSVS